MNQDDALNAFLATMSDEQRSMIESLEKNVVEKFMGAMMTPDGEPTPRLIEEIKKEMHEMEERTGSTDQFPEELKDIVRDSDKAENDAAAH
jgi:hypothetical protein